MRTKRIAALIGLVALVGAACTTTDPAVTPDENVSLGVTSPSEVGGNVVTLDVEATGIDIVAPDGDTSGDTGHFHVFIDRDPVAAGEVIPKEPGIVHSASDPIVISGISPGEHTFTVVFGDGNHQRIGDTAASATVTTSGPNVAAAATVDGSAVTVDATVEGVDVVVEPPSAEHLHYFLDVEPTLDGTPIPADDPAIIHSRETSVTFEDVAAGDHTIWVVLADGEHIPLDPPVWHSITVTVA